MRCLVWLSAPGDTQWAPEGTVWMLAQENVLFALPGEDKWVAPMEESCSANYIQDILDAGAITAEEEVTPDQARRMLAPRVKVGRSDDPNWESDTRARYGDRAQLHFVLANLVDQLLAENWPVEKIKGLCDEVLGTPAPTPSESPATHAPGARLLPAVTERVETGPVQFGDDWPGVFLRGDDAMWRGKLLEMYLAAHPTENKLTYAPLTGLPSLLASCSVRATK